MFDHGLHELTRMGERNVIRHHHQPASVRPLVRRMAARMRGACGVKEKRVPIRPSSAPIGCTIDGLAVDLDGVTSN